MNTLRKTRSLNAKMDGRGETGMARATCQNFLNLDYPAPLWLKARAQTIDFQRNDLEKMHWKKILRSILED